MDSGISTGFADITDRIYIVHCAPSLIDKGWATLHNNSDVNMQGSPASAHATAERDQHGMT
jgi:hypothetical protein